MKARLILPRWRFFDPQISPMLSHPHEVFLEVAQRLSSTKAGQALFLSQSAVSKQVKALEEYYQTGLFERLGGSVQLTPAGQKLYQKLLQAKQLQQELRQEGDRR